MYLSRLLLNLDCPQVWRDLTRPYELHRTVMAGYPPRLTAERVLYRLEKPSGNTPPVLLVQSLGPPDWSALQQRQPGYLFPGPTPDGLPNPAQRQWQPDFSPGSRLIFRLQANPCFKRGRRRLAWIGADQQRAWLQRKARQGGFTVRQLSLSPGEWVSVGSADPHPHSGPRLLVVRYEGLLEVTDSWLLEKTLTTGLGSARAFGCGLLSVAPAR